MKTQISGFELSYLISEMQFMIDGKVDKIFQPEKDEFLFRFHIPAHGKVMIRILLPNLIYLSSRKKDNAAHPSGFCMFLRKRLSGARLRSITQLQKERIAKFTFETKDMTYIMILELFGKGNLIICDAEEKMLSLQKSQEWRDRSMKVGLVYQPPASKPDFSQLSFDLFSSLIASSDQSKLVKFLANGLGLGGTYAQEICIRAGLDQSLDPSKADAKIVYAVLQELLKESLRPGHIKSGDDLIEIVPFPLQLYGDYSFNPVETFNSALDMIFSEELATPRASQVTTKLSKEQIKLQRIIEEQSQIAKDHDQKILDNETKANLIYTHYLELKDLLASYHQKKKSGDWEKIKQDIESVQFVSHVDLKHKTITVEFEE